jgi:predicted  nucleic acid-binding Zn-ribbon protein
MSLFLTPPPPAPTSATTAVQRISVMQPSDLTVNKTISLYAAELEVAKITAMFEDSQTMRKSVAALAAFRPVNAERGAFWNGPLIKELKNAIVVDVQLRDLTLTSLNDVRSLVLLVNSAAETIKITNGAPEAISIARAHIISAVDKIKADLNDAMQIRNEAKEVLMRNSDLIFTEIGGKSLAGSANTLRDLRQRLATLREELVTTMEKVGEYKLQEAALQNQAAALRFRLVSSNQAADETRRRVEEYAEQIRAGEERIRSIEQSLPASFWRRIVGMAPARNPNAETERDFYLSVIDVYDRNRKDAHGRMVEARSETARLTEQLGEVEGKIKIVQKMHADTVKLLVKKEADIKDEIASLLTSIEEEMAKVFQSEASFQLRGDALLSCIDAASQFSGKNVDQSILPKPLISYLEAVLALIVPPVELMTTNRQFILHAGSQLLALSLPLNAINHDIQLALTQFTLASGR